MTGVVRVVNHCLTLPHTPCLPVDSAPYCSSSFLRGFLPLGPLLRVRERESSLALLCFYSWPVTGALQPQAGHQAIFLGPFTNYMAGELMAFKKKHPRLSSEAPFDGRVSPSGCYMCHCICCSGICLLGVRGRGRRGVIKNMCDKLNSGSWELKLQTSLFEHLSQF